ncbi:MAG: exodeoxyribonuclease VII small subunit [Salinisphaeraceae bacterium]|nr:exodeoxyribonuclease VII small subunit [Salinisphaeraceae bacterium]
MTKQATQKGAAIDRIDDFEKALGQLEALVEQLEGGELSLEESLKQFEQGVKLARGCQAALKDAELQVRKLIEENGQARLEPLDPEEAGAE